MPDLTLATTLQLLLGLGLLNVWLLRSRSATSYRGGDAQSLLEEFAAYGLPKEVFYAVGALKLGAALALLAGLWWPTLVVPAALAVVGLMCAALAMHARIADPPAKSVPAAMMLLMSAGLSAHLVV